MPTIISRLKEHRQAQSITQEQLADKLGVTRQTINALETGRYEPSISLALQLARYFKTPVEKIFNLK